MVRFTKLERKENNLIIFYEQDRNKLKTYCPYRINSETKIGSLICQQCMFNNKTDTHFKYVDCEYIDYRRQINES